VKDPFVTFVPTINGGGMEIAMDCEKVVQTLSNVVNKLKQENQVDNVIIKNDIFKILEKGDTNRLIGLRLRGIKNKRRTDSIIS